MGDGGVAVAVLVVVDGACELIDVDILEYGLLGGVLDAGGVLGDLEDHPLELRVLAEVQFVDEQGDHGDGAGPCGKAVLGIPEGADGDSLGGVAGQAVGHTHGHVLYRGLGREDIVCLVIRDEVASNLVVDVNAGQTADECCRRYGCYPEFHSKVCPKCFDLSFVFPPVIFRASCKRMFVVSGFEVLFRCNRLFFPSYKDIPDTLVTGRRCVL